MSLNTSEPKPYSRRRPSGKHGGYFSTRGRKRAKSWSPQADIVHSMIYVNGSTTWPEVTASASIPRKSFQRCILEIERVYGVRLIREGCVLPFTNKQWTRYSLPDFLK